MYKLNLAFHDIVGNASGEWQIRPEYFIKMFDWCQKNVNDFCIYFDDGKRIELSSKELAFIGPCCNLAVVVETIGLNGYFGWPDLTLLVKLGFKISSHGYSHSSLCKYDDANQKILVNPKGGKYQSAPRGKVLLSEKEVEFQLIESKKMFEKHGFEVKEFVFPYGLYSSQTIGILDKLDVYEYYTTCEPGFYSGGKMIPRFLVYGNKTVRDNLLCLTKIISI